MHVVRVSRENVSHSPPRFTMSMHSISRHIALRFSQAHRAAGVVLAAALVTAACGDGATAVTSPLLNLRMASRSATASSFTVLANAAVTCTNGTITGYVGTFLATPEGSVTQTICPVSGTVHVGDAAAIAGYNAFLDAYAALAPESTTPCTPLTGTNFSVVMDGGALPCNVTWWVSQAATMTDSHFIGTIMAGAAITVTRG